MNTKEHALRETEWKIAKFYGYQKLLRIAGSSDNSAFIFFKELPDYVLKQL